MKRAILLLIVGSVMLAMTWAGTAASAAQKTGCAAEASVWTEVDFVTDPGDDWRSTGFFEWYWSLPGAVQLWYDEGYSDEEIYFAFASFFDVPTDRNRDSAICVWWIGGRTGLPDDYISFIDNHANARH